jgi:hypothetical protein
MEDDPVSAQLPWDLFGTSANTDTPDANGCTWTVASSEGWDAPDQRTQFDRPTAQHGQFGSNRYADGRMVVIRGLVFAPTQEAAWLAYDRITSAMPGINGSGDIISYEPVPKVLTVSQAGPPRASKPADGRLSFQLTLLAEYPWKRAVTAETVTVAAGAEPLEAHAGTFAAEIEVTTTSTGTVDLTIGSQRLRWGSLTSGSVLTSGPGFDNPKRTAVGPSGENVFGLIVQPMQWPAMAPGDNVLENNGTANLSVRYFPTYA